MPGERRYLGIAEEDTFGTSKDAAAFIDYLSAGLEGPSEPILFYEGAGSRGMALTEPGPYVPSGDIEFGVDPVVAAHFIKWGLGRYGVEGTEESSAAETTLASSASDGDSSIEVNDEVGFSVDDYVQISDGLGSDVVQITALDGGSGPTYAWTTTTLLNRHDAAVSVTEVVAPFKHLFRPTKDRTLPSFTARIGKDIFEHVFTGATIDRLSLSLERGFVTCSANLQCQKDSQVALNSASKSITRNILTFRQGITLLRDVDHTSTIEAFGIEISNNLDAQAGVRHGIVFPNELPAQGVDVSGSLTLVLSQR